MMNTAQQDSQQNEETFIEKQRTKVKSRVVKLDSGKRLSVNDCKNFNVYLVEGQIEIKRPGMAEMMMRSTAKLKNDELVFNDADRDIYALCSIECKFLLVPKNEVIKNSKEEPSKKIVSRSQVQAEEPTTIEISIYDLDRPYEDTVVISPEETKEIKNKNEELNQQNEEINTQKEELTIQRDKLSLKNKSIKMV